MSTRARTSQNLRLEERETLGCAGGERSEPGGRAELLAGGAPGAGGLVAGSARRGLSEDMVDEAVGRARLRRAVGELDGDARERLVDAIRRGEELRRSTFAWYRDHAEQLSIESSVAIVLSSYAVAA